MIPVYRSRPAGWRRMRLRFLVEGVRNGAWGSEPGEDDVDAICVRVADFDWPHLVTDLRDPTIRSFSKGTYERLALRSGDLLIEKSGGGEKTPVGRVVAHRGMGAAVSSNFVARVRPAADTEPDFLCYLLSALYTETFSHQFIKQNTGIQNLDSAALFSQEVYVPDLAGQNAIAAFLDAEAARIDNLIEKKQLLAQAVELRVEALRDAAVIEGLDPRALKRASGVDWFGDVPKHWCVCRFNRLIASKVDYRGRTPEKVDEGVFLVTARNVRNGVIDYERSVEFTTHEDWMALSSRGMPQVGDVIFTTEAPLGQIAQVDRTDVAFAQRIIKFRANPSMVSNDFLAEFMMSSSFQRSLQIFASGSTAAGIKSERFAHLFGLVPPAHEQNEIVAYIRSEGSKSRRLLQPLQKSVDALREYRAALITAAVTGQIDPAEWRRRGDGDRRLERIEAELTA